MPSRKRNRKEKPEAVIPFEGEDNFIIKRAAVNSGDFLMIEGGAGANITTPASATTTEPSATTGSASSAPAVANPVPADPLPATSSTPSTGTVAASTPPAAPVPTAGASVSAVENTDLLKACEGVGNIVHFVLMDGADFCSATTIKSIFFSTVPSGTTIYLSTGNQVRSVVSNGTSVTTFVTPCTECSVAITSAPASNATIIVPPVVAPSLGGMGGGFGGAPSNEEDSAAAPKEQSGSSGIWLIIGAAVIGLIYFSRKKSS